MKTYLDFLPCLMSQALSASRAATNDEEIQRRVVNAVEGLIPEVSLGLKPPELAENIKVGDKIVFAKFTGDELEFEGKKHLIVSRSDILAVIK